MTTDIGKGEFRSTGEPQSGLITGRQFSSKSVLYSDIDGVAIFEGDIALSSVDAMKAGALRPMGAVIADKESLWKGGVVPYQVDKKLPDPGRVRQAIAHWQAKTALKFVERTTANANQHPDYLYFEDQGGCWSYVGRQGGRQTVSLGPTCSVGNAIHEIGHAVGLWHEQSREDRDNHVRIRLQNVIPGREHNFDQHITDGDDVGKYDYASIMHYPRDAFSANGNDTIEPVQSGVEIGQRKALSEGDIEAVQALYS